MNTYRITLIRHTCEYAITEVDATTEEEAQRVAIALDECEGLAWTPDLDTYGVTEVDACELIGTADERAA